jgi:hypothetical protein
MLLSAVGTLEDMVYRWSCFVGDLQERTPGTGAASSGLLIMITCYIVHIDDTCFLLFAKWARLWSETAWCFRELRVHG